MGDDNSQLRVDTPDKTRRTMRQMIESWEATALYRTSSFLLLTLISVCAFVVVTALGDLKELTGEVRRLNDKLADIIGDNRVTNVTLRSHDSRLTALELWRNNPPPKP